MFWCTNMLPSSFIFLRSKKEEWSLLLYGLEIQSGKCPIFITYFLSFWRLSSLHYFLPLPSNTWAVIPLENNWASISAIQISQDRFCECRRALACSLSPSKQHWELYGWCQSETYCAQVKQQQGPSTAYLIERFHNRRQIKEIRIAKCKRMALSPSNAHHHSGKKIKLKLKQMQLCFIIHCLEP